MQSVLKKRMSAVLESDLLVLAEVATAKKDRLFAVGVSPTRIEELEKTAQLLRDAAARAQVAENAADGRLPRDRAYTFLSAAVDEVRMCADYAFRSEPDRRRGYHSEYFRKSNRGANRPAAAQPI
jgi:hypothetical protein